MIKIVEVGPRDGLQNEAGQVPTDVKIALVDALSDSGVSEIEVSAFVSPKSIPQLKDAASVFEHILRTQGVVYSALVPNTTGFERALEAGADKVAVFTAASETFNRKNINTSVDGSLKRFLPVVRRAVEMGLPVRGYISTAFWCAFEGKISAGAVVRLAERLMDMGVDEIAVSDTIGKATPEEVGQLMDVLIPVVPAAHLAVHFHDTYGNGIPNVLESVSRGIKVVDASVGGLGGCPFAPGATGNVSTEAVVNALASAGHTVNVDVEKLIRARRLLTPYLDVEPAPVPKSDSFGCSTCEFSNAPKCSKPS